VTDLVWTRARPEAPGWYWMDDDCWHTDPALLHGVVVRVASLDGYMMHFPLGEKAPAPLPDGAFWCGPLPTPRFASAATNPTPEGGGE
jgi:hypothetical protein